MLRIVADTNVLVSRLLQPRSIPAQVVRLALNQHTLLISEYLLTELSATLRKPKLAKFVADEERIYFLAQLAHYAEPVRPPAIVPQVCRDPKDDAILALAIAGQATHLVTGDADLLTLHPFQNISILTPAQFLEL